MLSTGKLSHCGVMVNYRCNAACRHCLYSCSPTRTPGYVNEDSMEEICRLLRKGGCRSVHIGGGEPFLDFEGLLMVVRKLRQAGIKLEYTETNAFWAANTQDQSGAIEKLGCLLAEGANCLCISIDPFHAEYVPNAAPLALAKLCEKIGMDYFLYNASKYPLHYSGRAINIEREFGTLYPAENFASDNSPCRNLLSTGHFHVDLHCYFIPPLCTGIILPMPEVMDGIPPGKYRAFEALYSGGVSALLQLAEEYGFTSDKSGYTSGCNLCINLRHFLSEKDFPELDKNHYEEALKYY